MNIARKYFVSGEVQGVGFRYFAQRIAAAHQVRGYVKNLHDGRVETLAVGPEKAVEAFRHDLGAGSKYSRIEHIEELVIDPTDQAYSLFRIEH